MPTLYTVLFEQTIPGEAPAGYSFGPVYHGGSWDGVRPVKVTGRGALGAGAYFTPIKSVAEQYAAESGGKLSTAYLSVRNPLKLHMVPGKVAHPCIEALVMLGVPRDKAISKVEKVEERLGYLGKEISTLALSQGYDALFQYWGGELREIVIWSSSQVKGVDNIQ